MQIPNIDPTVLHEVKQKTAKNLVHATRVADSTRKISLDDLGTNPHVEARLKRKIKRHAHRLNQYKLKVMLYKFENGQLQAHITDTETEQILSVYEGRRLEDLIDSLDTFIGLLLDITL